MDAGYLTIKDIVTCTLQDDFIILCPEFGTDKISGLSDL